MARCQYSSAPGLPVEVCLVHARERPCPDDGEPAIPHPIHVLACDDHRVEQIELARRMVAGTRPIMVHAGHPTDIGHLVEMGESQCWCEYVIIPSG